MNNSRLDQLLRLEKSDNQDPDIKYMIALEYQKLENKSCNDYFETLLKDFKDYLPTYYIAGEHYYNLEEYEKSVGILKNGLLIAQKKGNQKTLLEIKNLLMNVEIEL